MNEATVKAEVPGEHVPADPPEGETMPNERQGMPASLDPNSPVRVEAPPSREPRENDEVGDRDDSHDSSDDEAPGASRPAWMATAASTQPELEERVRRLEAAVAALQDTKHLEEHLIERIEKKRPSAPVAQVAQAPVAMIAPPVAAIARSQVPSELAMAGRVILPAAVGMIRAQADLAQAATPTLSAKPPWLVFEMAAELRAMFWMFFDRRYQLHWMAWLAPVLALVFAFNAWFFLGGTALFGFGHLVEKLLDLPVAYAAYKVLQRESVRYRQAFPPPASR